jgi:2-phospho-L-lactate guanylyltransferase
MPPVQTAVVIPVRALEGAKSRLGDVLDAEERRDLVTSLLRRTIDAARGAEVGRVIVVTDDDEAARVASAGGTAVVRARRPGLNAALDAGRQAAVDAGASILVVLPVDLPLVDPPSVRAVVEAAEPPEHGAAGSSVVVLVPDRHGRGTNALALRPPDVIGFAFGPDSRARHERLAAEAGARYVELDSPLAIDLDTAEDLLLVEDRLVGSDVA